MKAIESIRTRATRNPLDYIGRLALRTTGIEQVAAFARRRALEGKETNELQLAGTWAMNMLFPLTTGLKQTDAPLRGLLRFGSFLFWDLPHLPFKIIPPVFAEQHFLSAAAVEAFRRRYPAEITFTDGTSSNPLNNIGRRNVAPKAA